MAFEARRRSLLRTLNSRHIYGRIPLLHSLIFLIEITMISLLARRFNSYYASRPVFTTMITNAVLGGIADTVAQTLTMRRRKPTRPDKDHFWAGIDLEDVDRKPTGATDDALLPSSPSTRAAAPSFDFERLTRFMSYGFLMAPLHHRWFGFLARTFPIVKGYGTVSALKRVVFDQLLFAPVGLGCFFTFMTVAEGGGRMAVTRKFQDVYVPALKANFMVWPAVQILNFRIVPIQFQIPFVATIGIAWTAYLSLTNASDEQ